jgi:hypothetical protein
MSRPVQETITCKGCGSQQRFTLWTSLNVTLNREEKQQLIKGELTRFVCGKCGWSGEVVYPLLYHDMEQHLMFWLVPGGGELDTSALPSGGPMQGYAFRWVATRNELIEKILLFERGLDDRAVEFFKLLVRAECQAREHPITGTLLFADTGLTAEGEPLIRFEHLTDDGAESLEMPLASFNSMRESLADRLASGSSEEGKWLRIDSAYAKSLLGEPSAEP